MGFGLNSSVISLEPSTSPRLNSKQKENAAYLVRLSGGSRDNMHESALYRAIFPSFAPLPPGLSLPALL